MSQTVRLIRLRRLGWVLTLLALAVVGVSAWLRLAGAGLGCTNWPSCYAGFLGGATYVLPAGGRVIHRVVATTALLLALYACWRCLKPNPLQPVARQVLLLTGVMLLLSLVGIWSDDPRRVLANYVNLLGGLALVSFSWRIVMATHRPLGPLPAPPDRLLAAGLAALTLTLLLGAMIGARYAATGCATVPDCDGTWWPAHWTSLNPFATLSGPLYPGDPEAAALHLLHRYSAVWAVLLLGAAAWRVLRASAEGSVQRGSAALVMALLASETTLGILTVTSGYSLGLAIAHNVSAAALLAAAAQLSGGRNPPR